MVKSRRIGFSEVVAFEAACRVLGIVVLPGLPTQVTAPCSQLVISAGFAQALDLVARILYHVDALLESIGPIMPELPRVKARAKGMVEFDRHKLVIRAFSTNPATIRSFEGDLILDEYGAMPRQDAIWQAASPLASATLANAKGYRIRVIGTPLGDSNRFWRMCKGDLAGKFSVHEITLLDAVHAGFPLRDFNQEPCTFEQFKAMFDGDEDTFSQEYMCSFLSSSARYISEALYDAAYHEGVLPPHTKPAGAGMDVARSGHKSSIVELSLDSGGGMWLLESGIRSERNMPWPAQEAWAGEVIARCGTLAVDTTGIGTQFGERLTSEHGSSVVSLKFDTAVKDMIFSGLRLAFERKGSDGKPRLRVPREAPQLRRAVLSLRRRYSNAGNTIYDLDENAAGHGDEAVALALAVHACGGQVRDNVPMTASPVTAHVRNEQEKLIRPKRGAMFK